MRKNENFKICLTIIIALIISAVLIWLTFLNVKKSSSNEYTIKFYVRNNLVKEITHFKEERIDQDELDEIISNIPNEDNQILFVWSYEKETLDEVNFEELNRNATVYLFKLNNEFSIKVVETNQFDYKIIQDGPIKYGSNAKIKINPHNNEREYKPIVFANGKEITEIEENTFAINNIKRNIIITVELKELVTVELIDNVYTYDETQQNVEYVLKDSIGNIINLENVKVTYRYDNKTLSSMLNAGDYKIKFNCNDSKYLLINDTFNVTMHKAIPTLEIENEIYCYNGNDQSISKDQLLTNSNGEISFINNAFKDRGIHDVTVVLNESDNYLGLTKNIQIEVIKGNPTIIEIPEAAQSYYGDILEDVELIGGKTDVPGEFFWLNPKKHLYDESSKCWICFIPNDKDNYNYKYILLDITTISIEEMLKRIKIDKEETLLLIENMDLSNVEKLPIKASTYDADITWMSSSTVYQVNADGIVNILNQPGEYVVNLVGILTFRNVAEYINITFNLVIEYPEDEFLETKINNVTFYVDEITNKNSIYCSNIY